MRYSPTSSRAGGHAPISIRSRDGVTTIGQYAKRLESLDGPRRRYAHAHHQRMVDKRSRTEKRNNYQILAAGGIRKFGRTEAFAASDLSINGTKQPSSFPVVPSLTLVHRRYIRRSRDGIGPDLPPRCKRAADSRRTNPTAALRRAAG